MNRLQSPWESILPEYSTDKKITPSKIGVKKFPDVKSGNKKER